MHSMMAATYNRGISPHPIALVLRQLDRELGQESTGHVMTTLRDAA